MEKKCKLKRWVITIFVFVFLILPVTYAFYFSKFDSSLLSRFIFSQKLSDSYVRATVLTYWVDSTSCKDTSDLTTCDISGKNAWKLKDNVVNSDWILLDDGFYYYKTSINSRNISDENIKNSSIALIDQELGFDELVGEEVSSTNFYPQYEVIYEFIECDGVEDAWNVSYSTNVPKIKS